MEPKGRGRKYLRTSRIHIHARRPHTGGCAVGAPSPTPDLTSSSPLGLLPEGAETSASHEHLRILVEVDRFRAPPRPSLPRTPLLEVAPVESMPSSPLPQYEGKTVYRVPDLRLATRRSGRSSSRPRQPSLTSPTVSTAPAHLALRGPASLSMSCLRGPRPRRDFQRPRSSACRLSRSPRSTAASMSQRLPRPPSAVTTTALLSGAVLCHGITDRAAVSPAVPTPSPPRRLARAGALGVVRLS